MALATREQLLGFKGTVKAETVTIGGMEVSIHGIKEGPMISAIYTEAMAQEVHLMEIGERLIPLDAQTYLSYLFLSKVCEPSLSVKEIVQISLETGADCLVAGQRVKELSRLTSEAITEAKNDSGETKTDGKPKGSPSEGGSPSGSTP